jgi:hypothetical protein
MLERVNLNSAYWALTLQVADPFKRTLIMDAPFNFNKKSCVSSFGTATLSITTLYITTHSKMTHSITQYAIQSIRYSCVPFMLSVVYAECRN